MQQLPLFVFGTLRRGECNHGYLAGAYDRVAPARLLGFARIAPLMIARQVGAVVEGELFTLTSATYDRTLHGCDRLEELPIGGLVGPEYRRIIARIQTDAGVETAWVYASHNSSLETEFQAQMAEEQRRLDGVMF